MEEMITYQIERTKQLTKVSWIRERGKANGIDYA
jgi:hypothetical protein